MIVCCTNNFIYRIIKISQLNKAKNIENLLENETMLSFKYITLVFFHYLLHNVNFVSRIYLYKALRKICYIQNQEIILYTVIPRQLIKIG